jgi:hypothetical protein
MQWSDNWHCNGNNSKSKTDYRKGKLSQREVANKPRGFDYPKWEVN